MGAFGDGGDGKPSLHEKMLIDYLAEVFADPVLKWHADSIIRSLPESAVRRGKAVERVVHEDAVSMWRAGQEKSKPSRRRQTCLAHLTDIGWVAMHTASRCGERRVGSLQIEPLRLIQSQPCRPEHLSAQCLGRSLAIDSGYYPSYGSPHHTLWTRQTRAHNGILVNGRGQPPYNWDASGRIDNYEEHGLVTLVRGQAAPPITASAGK